MDRAFWWPYGCAKGTHESRLATYGAAAGILRHSIMTGARTGATATRTPLGPLSLGSASTLAAKLSTWHAGSPGAPLGLSWAVGEGYRGTVPPLEMLRFV